MSVVRVVLGYVVLFCLVLAGTWLVMLGFAFLPALIMRDWQMLPYEPALWLRASSCGS